MKIKELFEADGHDHLFTSVRKYHKDRREGPALPLAVARVSDPNYTPGKAALDREYKETEEHTRTKIPNIQKKLNDPRN